MRKKQYEHDVPAMTIYSGTIYGLFIVGLLKCKIRLLRKLFFL